MCIRDSDNGTIDNVVVAPEAPEPVEPAVPSATPPVAPMAERVQDVNNPAEVKAPKRVIKSQVEEHVFSLETETEIFEVDLSAMFTKVLEKNKALENLNKEMFNVVVKLSEQPVSEPTESKKKFSVEQYKADFKRELAELESKMSKENIN